MQSYRPALHANETELERITAIGDATDPGLGNAVNPNLNPFFQRGGKLLQYHGTADQNIPLVVPSFLMASSLTWRSITDPEALPTTSRKSARISTIRLTSARTTVSFLFLE